MHEMIDQIDAYLDGELGTAQSNDLREWVAADLANARVFARRVILHQEIRSILHRKRIECLHDPRHILQELLAMEEQSPTAAPVDLTGRYKQGKARYSSTSRSPHSYLQLARDVITPKLVLYASLAACLVLAVSMGIGLLRSEPGAHQAVETPSDQSNEISPIGVATLTDTQNAQWSGLDGATLVAGSSLYPGQRLTLTAGFAEITTARGAVAILEAPATIEFIDSDNALRLHGGKLVGLCHTPSSQGFVVKTSHADITDRGTEFGVQARPDGVDATVFVGAIELTVSNDTVQRITQNRTVKLTVGSNNKRELIVEDGLATGFAQRMPRPAVVKAAYINDERFAVEIVPQGLFEDAKANTDRDHEINGVDAAGLPPELIGGDLVRTPAHARPEHSENTEGLQIELELASPATVYVLYVKPRGTADLPGWLTENYTLTTLRVGLDLSGYPISKPELLGIGPGVSVDGEFMVWRRNETAIGRIIAAGNMDLSGGYSLVVVPAE